MGENEFNINQQQDEAMGHMDPEVTADANSSSNNEEIKAYNENIPEADDTPEVSQTGAAYQEGSFNNEYNQGVKANYQEAPRPQPYYVENLKKPREKKSGLLQLILVAVMSAILGGGAVAAAFLFVAPAVVPSINQLLGIAPVQSDTGVDRIVQITDSDSPVSAIAEKVGPSVVGIKVTTASNPRDFFFSLGPGVGEGSGIIISEDGYVVTNNHVISGAILDNSNKIANGAKIEVVLPNQKDKSYNATLVGRDEKTDLAVLKIEGKGFPAAELGDSDLLKKGELAVAIGNPGGADYMGSVTAGVISGLNRTLQDNNVLTFIQTDAAINPGNSGGALCNSKGQVIGINTAKIASSGYEGLGFAIPINNVKDITKSLIEFKYVKGRPNLGVYIDQRFNEDYAKQHNVPNGLLVQDVIPLSAAYKAGIKAGDIITSFDGKKVTVFKELEEQKNRHKPGDEVTIEVYRYDEGKTLTLKVILGEENNQ